MYKQLTPKYINMKVSNNNTQRKKTTSATKYRISPFVGTNNKERLTDVCDKTTRSFY